MNTSIPIFIGYDTRERAATNVLIDSLYQKSSTPLAITPIVLNNLKSNGMYWRERDSKQSTDFSFSRFLVPMLMNYQGWAIFMDCDMLCRDDITKLWDQRDETKALMCVKHNHIPNETSKFLGEVQSKYQKKNWSSLMMFNCSRCLSLTLDYVNNASGLELHQFKWLENDNDIGAITGYWNYLVDVDKTIDSTKNKEVPPLVHWTLGGPWFYDFKTNDSDLSDEWFESRSNAFNIAD